MTNMPEAKLAREAELCYATVAMVTDYDCWHPTHDNVTVDAIVKVLLANADKARTLIRTAAPARSSRLRRCGLQLSFRTGACAAHGARRAGPAAGAATGSRCRPGICARGMTHDFRHPALGQRPAGNA